MGVKMDIGIDSVTVYHSEDLKAVNVKTQPYPGFATDLQAPISVLLTQAEGVSEVEETIYKERNKHCFELEKMGAKTRIESNHFMFEGPCKLKGCEVEATDLRAGAAMIIAGLIAEGCTTITNAYHIYRGYEGIKEKLTALGAVVK